MEYLILGLLMLSPMTGYEIQQFIKRNLSLICSYSGGSLQTTLNRLHREGRISAQESRLGGRRKKTFSITPQGKEMFIRWVEKPVDIGRMRNSELSRLLFMGLAEPEKRLEAIRGYIRKIQQTQCVLEQLRELYKWAQAQFPEQQDDVRRFQGYALEYGIAAVEFERNWYEQLLKTMEEQE